MFLETYLNGENLANFLPMIKRLFHHHRITVITGFLKIFSFLKKDRHLFKGDESKNINMNYEKIDLSKHFKMNFIQINHQSL